MKKTVLIMTWIVLASLLLAACAGPGGGETQPSQATATSPAAEPTEAPGSTEAAGEAGALPDLAGREVTVAVENAYPPFNYIDEASGEAVGWDYDAVREICNRLNCTPVFQEAAWDGIFPAMAAGEFDMLADGVTYTEERDKEIDFSIPYVTVGQVLLVRADETATVDEMKADETKLVGTQIGTTNEIVALEHFTQARVQSFEDFGAPVQAVLSGDIDAVVIDNISALGFMGANEGQLKVIGQLTSDEQLAFGFPPGSELIEPVNAALESMIADGSLEEMNREWGLVQD